jgi:hypothetical protein
VVQAADHTGFALESLAKLRVLLEVCAEGLDHHASRDVQLLGEVDLAHPSLAEHGLETKLPS